MLKMKKQISTLLAAAMTFASTGMLSVQAEDYVYDDTVAVVEGVEVFAEDGGDYWLTNFQGRTDADLYMTHEAYEGSGALMIVPPEGQGQDSWVTNYRLSKDGITPGTDYKIEFYIKPVTQVNGKYVMPSGYRFWKDYNVLQPSAMYDAETGAEVTGDFENKWYRFEIEFTATENSASEWVGFAISMDANYSSVYIIDNLKMYENTGSAWVYVEENSGVRNGNFEEGVEAVNGANPLDPVAVVNGDEVTVSWTNPQDQTTNIYCGGELVATAEPGETNATITGLDLTENQVLILKGKLTGESSGVSVEVGGYEYKYADTVSIVNGIEVFAENGGDYWLTNYQGRTDAELYMTHEAYEGSGALMIVPPEGQGQDSWVTNYRLSKDGIIPGTDYKIEFYIKPVTQVNGKYVMPSGYRFWKDYNVLQPSAIYDAETGAEVTGDFENKWYRFEIEFTATESTASEWVGFAISMDANYSSVYIIDNLKMYENTGSAWEYVDEPAGVRNGNFEEGVASVNGVNPTDVSAVVDGDKVIISWTNPQEQVTNIYCDGELVATAEAGVTSVEITTLDLTKENVLTLKGFKNTESEGVTVTVAKSSYKYPDTTDMINGIEVFAEGGGDYWLTNFQGRTDAELYMTHESYEGKGAMMIIPPEGQGQDSWVTNYRLSKDGITPGTDYKIEFYIKPVTQVNGKYVMPSGYRFWKDYNVLQPSAMYDAETGAEVTGNFENKWYRFEIEFTATEGTASEWVGFAISMDANYSSVYIIDNLKMYENTGSAWEYVEEPAGVRNGDFEEGIVIDSTAPYEVENFKAEKGDSSVVLTWDAIDETEVDDFAGYTLFMNGEKIADLGKNITSYTVSDLEQDVNYVFTIKAYDIWNNSSEGTVLNVVFTSPEYIVSEFTMGEKVVQGTNTVSVTVENVKVSDGLSAQLIIGLFKKDGGLIEVVASAKETITVGNTKTFTESVTISDITAQDYELRAYVWDSFGGMKPLCEKVTICE